MMLIQSNLALERMWKRRMKGKDNEFIIQFLARCKFTTQTPTHYATDRKPAV